MNGRFRIEIPEVCMNILRMDIQKMEGYGLNQTPLNADCLEAILRFLLEDFECSKKITVRDE